MAYLDAVTRLGVAGPRPQYPGFVAAAASAAITGTVGGSTETQIAAGGRTVIITLTNDTWVATGASFNAQRQNILNGITSAQAEATGWNTVVRDTEPVGSVVRTSDTVVTVTFSAAPTYDISANETITVTVPASALVTSGSDVTGTPTLSITFVAEVSQVPSGGMAGFDFRELFRRQVVQEDREILLVIKAFLDRAA